MRASPLACFLVLVLLISSCKKEEETTTVSDGVGRQDDEIRLPPAEPTPDPTPPPWEEPQWKIVEIPARVLMSQEMNLLHFPYTKLTMKILKLGQNRKHKKCEDDYEDQCVVNRQIGFAFDLDIFKRENPHTLVVKDMQVVFDAYSIEKNKRSELLCSLDFRVCSGRGKPQNIIVKTFWQDGTFWKKGYERTVLTPLFQTTIDDGDTSEGLYIVKDAALSLIDLFKLRSDNFKEYAVLKKNLKFAVTDDTYVENVSLRVIYGHQRAGQVSAPAQPSPDLN